jgi:hypothetical protein
MARILPAPGNQLKATMGIPRESPIEAFDIIQQKMLSRYQIAISDEDL